MRVDCHTHLWRAKHWSRELQREGERMRGAPFDLNVTSESHWEAMRVVDEAIVYGLRGHHFGRRLHVRADDSESLRRLDEHSPKEADNGNPG